ncbi:Dihydroorotase protein [Halorhabdus tiamatea SARL4B]|uniref:Dihydroorotase n=1 Tax=Halorhabdus tiamatea SARL4B TaxID=1033806 RepID=F7PJ03_9EURY|nr:dihydroorotase [Halorhabdus tiamatea]ERJ05895.1 Dihydroorotase protein [Halorhabdus tiamatea SARL4B]CCQ32969.1 dihydroorotase [Halorhabdus tiamatea SARL4B]
MLIRNATLPDGRSRDVRIEGERIAAVEEELSGPDDEREIDATGKRLLPGMIDAHVHFRQPGYSHKETWTTGSKSAAAGGATTVVDQPNTDPPTVDAETFDEKADLAADSIVDFGLNGGVSPRWDPDSLLDRPLFALGEVFLADSTGDMGIDERRFRDALAAAAEADVTVTVHAEDASRFNLGARDRTDADAWSAYRPARAEIDAVERVCALASEYDVDVHIAHASTPEAIDAAGEAGVSCEVTPHHLLLSRSNLDDLGTHGRMNPPLRREKRRERVYERVRNGQVDIVATDHAPHTSEEKDAGIWDAPSGVPGVETVLPLLLEEARRGHLTYERVRDLTAANPAALFDLPKKGRIAPGYDADLVLVDPEATREIRAADLHTKCDWTPFEGWQAVFPERTIVRGTVVYDRATEDEPFADHRGRNVRVPVADPADETQVDASPEQPSGGSGTDDAVAESNDEDA